VRKRRRMALPSSVLDVSAAGDQSAEQLLRRVRVHTAWHAAAWGTPLLLLGCAFRMVLNTAHRRCLLRWTQRGTEHTHDLHTVLATCLMVCCHTLPAVFVYHNHQQVLGQVQPGGSLPLPQDWKSDNKQLQIRPLLLLQQQQRHRSPSPTATAAEDTPSHAWSYGVSSGQQSVLLPSLEDGASRLLCCPTLGVQRSPDAPPPASAAAGASGGVISPRSAAAAAPSCWFTVMADATELSLQVSCFRGSKARFRGLGAVLFSWNHWPVVCHRVCCCGFA
jgi:hypothetical protein